MLQAEKSLISSDGILMTKSNFLFYFFSVIAILFARVAFDVINQIEVHFDEAQYWVWSQNLSLSYLSKGPLVPSLIAFSNQIFGQTYFGLKFFSFVAYLGTIITLSLTAFKISNKKTSFYNALILSALSPAIFILGGVASTDIFLFLFWSLTLLSYVRFFKDRDEKWFYVIGITTGLGILAKLTMVLLPLSILLYFLTTDLRKYFLNIHGGIVPNYRNVHGQFWAYFNKDYSNMGSSILHLTKGIDDGNIALMSNLDIHPESLKDLHLKILMLSNKLTEEIKNSKPSGRVVVDLISDEPKDFISINTKIFF